MERFPHVLPLSACLLAGLLGAGPGSAAPPVVSQGKLEASASPTALPDVARERIEEFLRREELAARPVGPEAYRLDNPVQQLSVDLSPAGVHLQPAATGATDWDLLLAWQGCRRAGDPAGEPGEASATLRAEGPRVEIERSNLREWYVNDERGIEQGVTLAVPPPGTGSFVVEWIVGGTLTPELQEHGETICFGDDGGPVLRYRGLVALDATGRVLPSHLGLDGDRLWISVDDEGAPYPVVIDPWIEQAELSPSDPLDWCYFGCSIDISGDTVVVGGFGWDGFKGAVYVFEKPGGAWADMTQIARLTSSTATPGDTIGYSVAIDGDVVVTGGPSRHGAVGTEAGSAWVFVKPAGGWVDKTEDALLLSSDLERLDRFGESVDVHGDTVVVGAYGDSAQRGAAYVFVEPSGGWSGTRNEVAKLRAGDADLQASLGFSVATRGDLVVAGAPGAKIGTAYAQGAAYLFVRPGGGWIDMFHTAKLLAGDGEAADALGRSVDVAGDTVVAGATGDDSYTGAVYAFVEPGGGWVDATHTAKLTAADKEPGDHLGSSVSLRGDEVAAGAPYEDGAGSAGGAAYFFAKPPGGWIDAASSDKVLPGAIVSGNQFGWSVGVDGGVGVVGAWLANGGAFQSGRAFVFVRTVAASAVFRNAGTNPASYDATSLPVLGSTYGASIDLAGTTGHSMAWLVGYATPLTLPLGAGPTLLVNALDPGGELLHQAFVGGPVATYSIAVPSDVAYMGFTASTQALHWGGGSPFDLSNAQDLTLGL